MPEAKYKDGSGTFQFSAEVGNLFPELVYDWGASAVRQGERAL